MAAFLYRDNSHLVYPQILYLFAVLLALNLGAGYVLSRWGANTWMSALFILGNCATITAIMTQSGGEDSNLWVLFLLPIYTVCMLLNGREVIWITAGVLLFNLSFYQFTTDQWDAESAFYLCLKSGIFIFAAIAIWSVSSNDRKAQERLKAQKLVLDDLETEIQKQAEHAVQLEKMADVGEMSSGVAHDLNNPLTVIIGTVKVLMEEQPLESPLKYDLMRILRSAELCQTIASNVLGLLRKQEPVKTTTDLNKLVESVLDIYGQALTSSGIRVEKNLSPALPSVEINEPQIQRVLLNILSNAKGAMKSGGTIAISTAMANNSPLRGPALALTIEDDGPGFTPEIEKDLFKPFHTTKGAEGHGLGLYLSREIVSRHAGLLQASNRPTGGARFTILLPALVQGKTLAA